MGIITPITNLLPLEISRPNDIEPTPVEKVESSPRTDDETYSPSNQQAADGAEGNGAEGDGSTEDVENLASDDEADPTIQPTPDEPTHTINLLA
jgi:hypothetical protein